MPETKKRHIMIANTVGAHMSQEAIQHMVRVVRVTGEWITSSGYAEAKADRCKKMTEEKDAERFTTNAMMIKKERWQHRNLMQKDKIFNVHSVRSAIIEKLKTKSSQRTHTCKCKIDTDSDGNLMPIRMYKMLFLHTNVNELNISKKIVLHAYNNVCIPQMGISRVTIIN